VNAALLFVLLSLATFRLTMLIVFDSFPPIAWVRTKIQHARPFVLHPVDIHHEGNIYTRDRQDYWWLGELIGCAWCASAYVSGLLVLITWLIAGLPLPVLWWFAVWGAGAYLASSKTE
jgi:hypothetical protein